MKAAATAILLLAIGGPLLVALMASFAGDAALFAGPGAALSALAHPTFAHYRALFGERGFLAPVMSSLIVAVSATALCLVVASLGGYALARARFPGRSVVLGVILMASMFPQIAIVSPLYLLLRALGLLDRYPGLVLPYLAFALPLAVWSLSSFFAQLPAEIEEAARVDGASALRVLASVVLPMSWPGLAATGILTFVYCWNELLFALAFMLRPEHHTLPVAIAFLRGRHEVPWGQVMAAATVATLPVALLVLAFQRRITSGLIAGATKA